jgi:hypothetical protein
MQAVLLAKKDMGDPEGNRTIGTRTPSMNFCPLCFYDVGVLTKPDMLGEGASNARNNWKEVLEGTKHITKHGYYCVRLPDDEQRGQGVTRIETQRVGDEFFNNTAPWNQINNRSCFGIPNFVKYISALLVELIEN